MQNGRPTFRVVFWGEVILGQQREIVEQKFAKWFRIRDRGVLARLFCGRLLTLKRGLSQREAQRYCEVIRGIGALCRMEPEYSVLQDTAAALPREITEENRQERLSRLPELRLVNEDEGMQAEVVDENPFAARDVESAPHPPMKYYDPR